jgi:hypothetical protein
MQRRNANPLLSAVQKLARIGLHVGRAAPASQVSIQPVFLARAPARKSFEHNLHGSDTAFRQDQRWLSAVR